MWEVTMTQLTKTVTLSNYAADFRGNFQADRERGKLREKKLVHRRRRRLTNAKGWTHHDFGSPES